MKKHSTKKQKKQLIFLAALCVLTLLTAACLVVFSILGGKLQSQQAAERFAGESGERFAQVSVFFPVGKGVDESGVYSFRKTLEAKLTEASIETPENGSLWIDFYCASGELGISGPRGSATAPVLGLGGDFFLFNPLRLRSGGYISGDDLMHDRVVLDEELAWKLFGGTDVAGLEVTIAGKPYLVAGVVAREADFADKKAYNSGAGLFMAYDALNALSPTEISCYGMICADPVSGFSKDVASNSFEQSVVVENSDRYTVEGIFKVVRDFGKRSMNTAGVVFPYWENAARLLEDYMALLLVLAILLGLLPAICAAAALIIALRRTVRRAKAAMPTLRDKAERRAWERRESRRTNKKNEKDGQPEWHK